MINQILEDHFALEETTWTDTTSMADHVAGLVYAHIGDVLKLHFPEYISASCLCGEPTETYDLWVEHVLSKMGKQQ